MDLGLSLLAIVIIGLVKAMRGGLVNENRPPELQLDGTVKYFDKSSIPVGDNLTLMKEPEPFMKIVKQLGLVR